MSEYQPLTKKVTDNKGSEIAVCRYYGTESCRKIHTPNGCESCPIMRVIFEQLNAFEEIYLSSEGESNES